VPYLAGLGVDAVWLTPYFPSPQRDHGYDVADYLDVDPVYGTLADIDALVGECHRHGLRVLVDVVPNHCSSEHRWFRDALAAPPGSAARRRFFFRDGRGDSGELPPNNWPAAFGGSAWTRVPDGQWYLATFTPWQPDFDWSDQAVVADFDEILRFWLARGIDGFRVDAVTHVGKAPGLPDAPPRPVGIAEIAAAGHNPFAVYWPSAHDVWRHWRTTVDAFEAEHPDRQVVLVAEAYTARRPDLLMDYVRGDEFHEAFSFDLMLAPWHTPSLHRAIDDTVATLHVNGAAVTWTLNNHDTQRAVTRYGRADAADPASWTGNNVVYTGTQVDLALGTRRARAAMVLVAGLPGSLFVYAGEELGLPEVLDLPDAARTDPIFLRTGGQEIGRDGCRVPLPWDTDPATAYGFSAAPAVPWLPQPDGWSAWAVDAQVDDPGSMLALYREVLRVRRTLAHETDHFQWIDGVDADLLAFRRADVAVVLNPTTMPCPLPAELAAATLLLSSDPTLVWSGIVPPDTAVWLGR
jgi:alpha-glucosidase